MIAELVKEIPIILLYVVPGYLYLATYNWIRLKNVCDSQYFVYKSVLISYVFKIVYEACCLNGGAIENSEFSNIALLLLLCVLCGAIFAIIASSKPFSSFLLKVHIGRTSNSNIWDDLLQNHTLIRIYMEDNTSYYGVYKYAEENKSEPIIALVRYQKLDEKGNVIPGFDYSNDTNELIVLNTKDFKKIEITYTKEEKPQ